MLTFKVKEKNKDGELTGHYWDMELEQSNFASLPIYGFEGVLRFSGDVLRVNQNTGAIVQRGIMKFEFEKAETEASSDDDLVDDLDDDDFDW